MSLPFDLAPGDVISYSAGSTQTGPEGFRKLRSRPGLFQAALARWPDLAQALAGRPPLVINAYPASIGIAGAGISVDTYLSPRVLSRALQLAAAAELPAVLCGQPLFVADALLAHLAADRPLPRTMLIMVGGYPLPATLEAMLTELLAPRLDTLHFLQGYGVAEVDAGCMMGRERDGDGQLIYYARPDVDVELDGEQVLLSLRDGEGKRVVDRWATGDSGRRSGEGWVLWNPRRCHPVVDAAFASWSADDWTRRTGYLHRDGETLWLQLRQGRSPRTPQELDHWDFGRIHGFSWLDKPVWK
ncbi:MAG: hypothetical protein KC457_24035 [Myxococcales bacterium]|nr:hypothetical protein [Myxococcales bacterium]